MKCSKCGWESEDKFYFYELKIDEKIYSLCSACWANHYVIIERIESAIGNQQWREQMKRELIAEIEGEKFEKPSVPIVH